MTMAMENQSIFVMAALLLIITLAEATIQHGSAVPLTLEKLGVVLQAKELSNDVYGVDSYGDNNLDCQDSSNSCTLESGSDFGTNEGDDRVFLVDQGEYCFVAFKGSEAPNPDPNSPGWNDWIEQNFDTVITYTVEDGNGNQCLVQGGFYDAYLGRTNANQGIGYQAKVESWIKHCMESRGNKQLILTGHSQGGSVATIAGLIHQHYDSIVINFGAPPVIVRNNSPLRCHWPNGERFWRFINTEMDSGGMDYDAAPFLGSLLGTWHLGANLILQPGDVNDAQSLKYIDSSNPERYQSLAYLDADLSAHSGGFYLDRIEALYHYLQNSGRSSVDISGFPIGSGCRYSDECSSNRCDWDSYNPLTSIARCYPKLGRGEWCNEDSDCKSNKCSGWWWQCR